MVRLLDVQREGRLALEHHLVDAHQQRAQPQPLVHRGLEVARPVELVVQPGGLEGLRIGLEHVVAALGAQRFERGLGGEHAGLDRGVAALDPAGVEEARLAADECAAREHRAGSALKPPAVSARAP